MSKMDITPQLAIMALNVLIDYCCDCTVIRKNSAGTKEVSCGDCIFSSIQNEYGESYCEEYFWYLCPCEMERIEIPCLDGNTVTYFEGAKLHRTTCGNRQEAEALFMRIRRK